MLRLYWSAPKLHTFASMAAAANGRSTNTPAKYQIILESQGCVAKQTMRVPNKYTTVPKDMVSNLPSPLSPSFPQRSRHTM